MAFSSNKGLHISLPKDIGKNKLHEFLFNEEIGFVIEINSIRKNFVIELFKKYDIRIEPIATPLESDVIEILSGKDHLKYCIRHYDQFKKLLGIT